MSQEITLTGSRYGAVAETARWTAAARARESRRPDRLFDDPFAEALSGSEGAELLRHFDTSRTPDDGNPFLAIRTRWFDDVVGDAVSRGVRQIVGLGAGLDTRAYRCDWTAGTVLFELDQAHLLRYKEGVLRGSGAAPRCDLRRVPVDFSEDWTAALAGAGHDPAAPTAWFVEGLFFYLPEPLARDVMGRAAGLSAPGSVFAADFISTGIFRFPYMRSFLRKLEDAGSPWVFGTDDPGGLLAGCGWRTTVVTEPGRPGAQYGRWAPAASPGALADLPRSFLVSAERA